MSRFEIRIDELVLRGVPREQAVEVAEQVEARLEELAATATTEGIRGSGLGAVRTPSVPAGDGQLGRNVAERVWSAVSGAHGGQP